VAAAAAEGAPVATELGVQRWPTAEWAALPAAPLETAMPLRAAATAEGAKPLWAAKAEGAEQRWAAEPAADVAEAAELLRAATTASVAPLWAAAPLPVAAFAGAELCSSCRYS
jgi:hypothetical protein